MAKNTVLEEDSSIYKKRTDKKERDKLKGLPLKKKLEYIKDYYLKAAIAIIVIASVVIYMLLVIILPKDEVALRLVAINDTYTQEDKDFLIEDFGKVIDYNPDKQEISIQDSFFLDPENLNSNVQDQIMIYTLSGTLDVIIADKEIFTLYAQNNYFMDLSEVFSPTKLDTLTNDLLYSNITIPNDADVDPEDPDFIDPTIKRPYGISLDSSDIYKDISTWYQQQEESGSNVSYYIGILNTSKQKENATAFIEYLKNIQD